MTIPWKYVLVSVAIGALLGGSVGMYYAEDLAKNWTKRSPETFLKHLDHNLHLSEPQKAQLLSVLSIRRDKMLAYEDQVRKETRLEIRNHLMPEQQAKFDAIVARHDAERKKQEMQQ